MELGQDTVIDAPAPAGEATAKETPDVSAGTESVASEPKGQEQAGESQDRAEGDRAEGQDVRTRRGPSKLDTIKELRMTNRELRARHESEIGAIRAQLDEMKALMQSRTPDQKPSKTFWEAPEEVLEERMKANMAALKDEILQGFQKRDTDNQQTTEWKQETSEAAKFIQTQRNVTPEDHEDIAEIIRTTPAMQNLRPMDRAKYAVYLWQQERGINDRSALKAKAATVVGAPSAGGKKTWTEAEVNAELDKFPKDMSKWTPEQKTAFDALEREIRDARRGA